MTLQAVHTRLDFRPALALGALLLAGAVGALGWRAYRTPPAPPQPAQAAEPEPVVTRTLTISKIVPQPAVALPAPTLLAGKASHSPRPTQRPATPDKPAATPPAQTSSAQPTPPAEVAEALPAAAGPSAQPLGAESPPTPADAGVAPSPAPEEKIPQSDPPKRATPTNHQASADRRPNRAPVADPKTTRGRRPEPPAASPPEAPAAQKPAAPKRRDPREASAAPKHTAPKQTEPRGNPAEASAPNPVPSATSRKVAAAFSLRLPSNPGQLKAFAQAHGARFAVARTTGRKAELVKWLGWRGNQLVPVASGGGGGLIRKLRDPQQLRALGDPAARVAEATGLPRGGLFVEVFLDSGRVHAAMSSALHRAGIGGDTLDAQLDAARGAHVICRGTPSGAIECTVRR